MALRTSNAFKNGRDDDRTSGLKRSLAERFFGGQVVTQDNADPSGLTIQFFAGATALGVDNPLPLGLVFESNVQFPVAPQDPDQFAGRGFDNLDYARGGIHSVFHRPGNFIEVFDDRRSATLVDRAENSGGPSNQVESAPFIVTDGFNIGDTVFSTDEGMLTTNSTGATAVIGTVRAEAGSAADQVFTLELHIRPV